MQLLHRKPQTHEARILQALKKAGHHGMYNHELARQSIGGLDWRKCISRLRRDEDYVIDAVQIKKGVWKYYLDND